MVLYAVLGAVQQGSTRWYALLALSVALLAVQLVRLRRALSGRAPSCTTGGAREPSTARPPWHGSWVNSVVLGLALSLGLLAAQVLLADQAPAGALGPAVAGGLVYGGLLERRRRRGRQPDASP